ncbi:hypothetical protein ACFX1R_048400 [Malus domestica]
MGSVKRNRPDEPEKSFFRSEFEWVRGPKLGSGGFGSVYLATVKKPKLGCEGFPTVMAVKTFSEWSEQATESSYLYLFRDCLYVIGSYGKNLTIGDDGYVKYNVFLEYADGGTIGDLIKKSGGSGLCESDVRNYTKAILSGLEYIHESGYVHCDLKPENILLVTSSSGFVPKIGDFGLAKDSYAEAYMSRNIDVFVSGSCLLQSPGAAFRYLGIRLRCAQDVNGEAAMGRETWL